jgi:hypothetical protein
MLTVMRHPIFCMIRMVISLSFMSLVCLGCEKSFPAGQARQTKNNSSTGQLDSKPSNSSGPQVKIPETDDDPPTSLAKKIGKNVYFERNPDTDHRRVFVNATVCLREGSFGLECLMCRKGTKEHESILATDSDARLIHAGLEAAHAKPGAPVQFDPKFKSPTGTPIKITLVFPHEGKTVFRPAQEWIRNVKTNKDLEEQWVFTGSALFKDPDDPKKEPIYLATAEGAYISVTNVPTATLDLPVLSPKQLESREFSPHTERIPELDTKVVMILEPILGKNNK